MAKVTRTKVVAVAKYTKPEGITVITPFHGMDADVVREIADQLGTNVEVGYMPLSYEMEEKDFMRLSNCVTDMEKTPMFATREECPKSLQEMRSYKKN